MLKQTHTEPANRFKILCEQTSVWRQIFARSDLAHSVINRQLVNAKACARACTNSNSTVCATVASGEIINAVPLRCTTVYCTMQRDFSLDKTFFPCFVRRHWCGSIRLLCMMVEQLAEKVAYRLLQFIR